MEHKSTLPPCTLPDHNELAVMRTLMASERTFLAWCRTAMALIGFGFILEKFTWYLKNSAGADLTRAFHEMGALSTFAFCAGCLIIFLDGIRFIRTRQALSAEHRVTAYIPELILITAMAVILIVCILYSQNILL
ncbi:MAG: DUF202 domain-containing protein [Desulfoplanes sp.]|nr:DUF202 domain-containing protein [Desulfoplanes sp.]